MENDNKELDLLDLIKILYQFIQQIVRGIGNSVLWVIRFSFRNWIIIGLFFLLGICLAINSILPGNRLYYEDFIIRIHVSENFVVSDFIESLNEINGSSNTLFAKTLGINQDLANNIKKIESFYVIDLNNNNTPDYVDFKHKYSETGLKNVRMANRLCIRITTTSPQKSDKVQAGIIYYLNHTEYMKKETIARNNDIIKTINVLNNEIITLDSMRRNQNNYRQLSAKFDKTLVFGEPRKYQDEMLQLIAQKNELQTRLFLFPEGVSQYSTVLIRPAYSEFKIFGIGLIISYIIGFIIALFVNFRKKIAKILKG